MHHTAHGMQGPWDHFLACHKLNVFPDNRYRTCGEFRDHTEKGIVVVNVESLHEGAYKKTTGDNYRGLDQVNSK